MLRTIVTILFVVIFLILSLPFLLIECLVKHISPEAYDWSQLRVVQWGLRVVAFLSGAKTTYIGLENIPTDEPVLFIGNHQSIFDIVLTYGILPNKTGFISKDGMKKVPVIATYMNRIHCLFLSRDNLKEGLKVITQAIAYVKEGVSMFIYPEGHRNKSGDPLKMDEFKDGSFKIAQRTGCKIIPVATLNTPAIFESHFPAIKKAKVVIEFGKPVSYAALTPEERKHVGSHFRGIVLEMLENNLNKYYN
ncbi:MAG: lysophospholipid acyltransferase family protein [Lachnospiraceae bacterium]|nr:lysophospholipid acyltransferase family protein [Lachnospiraceae bacterium]